MSEAIRLSSKSFHREESCWKIWLDCKYTNLNKVLSKFFLLCFSLPAKKIFHAKSKDLLTGGAPLKEPLKRAPPGPQDLAIGRGPRRKPSTN